MRALLVRGQVGFQVEVPDPGVVRPDPGAGAQGGLAGEVLPGRVAGGVVEPQEHEPARGELLDVVQAADPGGGIGLGLDRREAGRNPVPEGAGLPRAVEAEGRGALHDVRHHGGPHPAGRVDQLHAAVVARHQGALGRGQRHVERPAGMLAVNQQRPRHPDRHLGHADEVLDVPGQDRRVERIAADMLRGHPSRAGQERHPLPRRRRAVIVVQPGDLAPWRPHRRSSGGSGVGCGHDNAP